MPTNDVVRPVDRPEVKFRETVRRGRTLNKTRKEEGGTWKSGTRTDVWDRSTYAVYG